LGSAGRQSAQVAEVSFPTSRKKKLKKRYHRTTFSLSLKSREFKKSLGSWPGKASSSSSPFLNQVWACGEPRRESVGELRLFIFKSNPDRIQQAKLESG